ERASSPIDRIRELPAEDTPGGSPGEAFTVFLSLDARLVDLRQGFVLRPAPVAGDHGHDPRRPEMDAAFLVAGPGVPAGRDLGRIDMRDVAPTLAHIAGLRLPEAEGRDRLAAATLAGLGRCPWAMSPAAAPSSRPGALAVPGKETLSRLFAPASGVAALAAVLGPLALYVAHAALFGGWLIDDAG